MTALRSPALTKGFAPPSDDPAVIESRRRIVADFAAYAVEHGRGSLLPWALSPVRASRAIAATHGLPQLRLAPTDTAEGLAVRRGLTRSRRLRTAVEEAAGVLALPPTLEEYVQTPARRPLRRKVRVANRLPVSWRIVEDAAERRALVEIADARERVHPDPLYRHDVPDNGDLFDIDLWIGAFGPDGSPLMLAVVPVDGHWATLRYFRTLTDGDAASVARYLMTEVLVGQLIDRGVRWLADTESPFVLPNGLRHFQKMVGFELFRVRLT